MAQQISTKLDMKQVVTFSIHSNFLILSVNKYERPDFRLTD